jgi:hypothetical protein
MSEAVSQEAVWRVLRCREVVKLVWGALLVK